MVEDLEGKIKVFDATLGKYELIDEKKFNGIPKIHKQGNIVYCYCVHFNRSCFDTIRHKCNGYREYREVIPSEERNE
jgi:hypothetical protein